MKINVSRIKEGDSITLNYRYYGDPVKVYGVKKDPLFQFYRVYNYPKESGWLEFSLDGKGAGGFKDLQILRVNDKTSNTMPTKSQRTNGYKELIK